METENIGALVHIPHQKKNRAIPIELHGTF
jgi:hypothetical protein